MGTVAAPINLRTPIPSWLGGSYPPRSIEADAERSINVYTEITESGAGKSQATLYGTPGLTLFSNVAGTSGPLPGGANMGHQAYTYNGVDRVLAIAGTTLYEIFQDGSYAVRGSVLINQPAHWAYNERQVAIATGTGFYYFDFESNVLAQIAYTIQNADGTTTAGTAFVASDVEFIDGYLFALITGTNQVTASAPFDATMWNPLDFTTKSGASDPAVGLAADHLQLYIFGAVTTEVYYDSANPTGFPFSRVVGGFIQRGMFSPSSQTEMDDGIFWIGANPGGGPVIYRNSGYSGLRISNHAVEAAMNSYPTAVDAVSSYYVEDGHQFFLCHFPSANNGNGHTWVYDTATQLWHERLFWNQNLGQWQADPARYITFAWNQQIAADWRNGNICLQSLNTYTTLDANGNSAPLRRQRTSPPIARTMNWNFFHEFELDLQTGLSLPTTPNQGSFPLAILQFSDDGGYTWSNEIVTQLGQIGQTAYRALWRRLGSSRDRVFRVTISDPIPVAIVNAYMRMSPGTGA
jgi:hypothetical protein